MPEDVVFSEYEADMVSFKFGDGSEATVITGVAKFEQELEVKTVVKKARGKVIKTRTRGTGNGTIKATIHAPIGTRAKIYAMERDDLIEGTYAFGENSVLPEGCVCVHVIDEDNKESLKAFPRSIVTAGPATTIENGGDEVEAIEIELSVMPDENGEGMYQAYIDQIDAGKKSTIVDSWMKNFNRTLVANSKELSAETSGNQVAVNSVDGEDTLTDEA